MFINFDFLFLKVLNNLVSVILIGNINQNCQLNVYNNYKKIFQNNKKIIRLNALYQTSD